MDSPAIEEPRQGQSLAVPRPCVGARSARRNRLSRAARRLTQILLPRRMSILATRESGVPQNSLHRLCANQNSSAATNLNSTRQLPQQCPVMVDPGPNGMALEAPAAGIGFRMHEAEKIDLFTRLVLPHNEYFEDR
jgi:hypothetical protein